MSVAGQMVMKVQTIGQQAEYRVDGILNNYPIDYYDKYPARLSQVNAEQVRAVMNKYVSTGEMTIVAEGQRSTYKTGDTFSMTNGCRHAEHAGPDGATYVAGRRKPATD